MNSTPSSRTAGPPAHCPQCGSHEVSTKITVDHFTYGEGPNAREITATVPVRNCNTCQLQFLDHAGETARHTALCRALGLLTPSEIKAIRSAHCMTRTQFSRLTRIGVATLSRWERGITLPNPANDQFLRLLQDERGFALLQQHNSHANALRPHRTFRALADPTGLRAQQNAFRLRLAS